MKTELKEKWAECVDEIRSRVSSQDYDTWFKYIAPSSFRENRLTIQVPTLFVSKYIEDHYVDVMTDVITRQFGSNTYVEYKVGNTAKQQKQEVKKMDATQLSIFTEEPHTLSDNIKKTDTAQESKKNIPEFNSQLCDRYTFDNFIEGDSNRLARSVGQTIAINPAQTFNPFFIYGPSGCGKTHLANAIGLRTKELHPELRVLYMSAHLFYVQYANATKENKLPDFISFYQTIDVLIIDDVHELSGKTATQNTFFHIFNHLHLNKKQLIFTADRPPMEITGLEERLLTRFKWGLPVEIEKPDKVLRRAVLRHKVLSTGLQIPDAVVTYIADTVNESFRDLEGILNSLKAYSVVYNLPINMKLADKVLQKFTSVNIEPLSISDIKRIICRHYNIQESELCSSTRRQPISQIRQIAIYFASKLTNETTVQIGHDIGGRSHSTILHSINHVENLIETDKKIKDEILRLEDELSHR